jgi:hypothetical protein
MQTILQSIVADPSFGKAIQHPLGFLQVKLGRLREGHLKWHVWLESERFVQDPPWLIHRHVWPVFSHVLVGAVTNETFLVEPHNSDPTNVLYLVEADGEESVLHRTKTEVTCLPLSQVTVRAGEFYGIDLAEYHSTEVFPSLFASTVILSPPPSRESAEVVGDIEGANEYRYHRSDVDLSVVSAAAQRVLDSIVG